MTVFGWDASDYDWERGPMDLAAAVRDGIGFFTHKATEGTSIRHVHYRAALERARDAGMRVYGAYMVPRTPGNGGHGPIADQVAYFIDYLDAQTPWWRSDPRFRIGQIDTEKWSYDAVSPSIGAQACTLLARQTQLWVVHYAPRWAYGDTIPGTDPVWASAYGTNPATHYREAYPGDGSSIWAPYSGRTPTFVQYGSQLTVGSQPQCDVSAYRGQMTELLATIGGSAMATTTRTQDFGVTGLDKYSDGDLIAAMILNYDPEAAAGGQPINGLSGRVNAIQAVVDAISGNVDDLSRKLDTLQIGGQPTQDQVDHAVLKAMQDPEVQAGIAAAIASHLKVV